MSQVQRIVLFARFSAFASQATFHTQPINVRAFARTDLTAWRSGGLGTITACAVFLEESADLLTWTTVPSSTIALGTAGVEVGASCDLELPWVRCAFKLEGHTGGPAVSGWAVGNFTLRDA